MLFTLCRLGTTGLVATLLVACGAVSPNAPSAGLPSLAGGVAVTALTKAPWKLVTIQEGSSLPSARLKAGIPANHMRLSLTSDQVSFVGGCNRTSGKVLLSTQGQIKITELMSTEMACAPELMLADTEMADYLMSMAHYEVNDKRLKLSDSDTTLSFVTTTLTK
ncbi:MAG: hypothetical protein RLZZ422_63 [Pseudomonadota bacterium]